MNKDKKKKQIIIVTSTWPPVYSPGARRVVSFAKFFMSKGYDVHIYTYRNQNSLYGSGVTKIFSGMFFHLVKNPIPQTAIRERNTDKNIITKKILKLLKKVGVEKNFIGSLSIIRLIYIHRKEYQNPVILGSFPDGSNILVAYIIKKILKGRLISDFRDAWTKDFDYKFNLFTPATLMLEKQVVKQSWLLTYVSPGTKKQLQGILKRKKKSVLLINGVDKITCSLDTRHASNKRYFGYIGSIIGANRDPIPLLKAVKLANENCSNQINLEIYTNDNMDSIYKLIEKYKCSKHITVKKAISYSKLPDISSTWEAGIVITRTDKKSSGELTTKLFDYIGLGLPTITIAPQGFDINQISEELPNSVCIPPENIELLSSVLINKVFNRHNESIAKPFLRENIMFEALDGIL